MIIRSRELKFLISEEDIHIFNKIVEDIFLIIKKWSDNCKLSYLEKCYHNLKIIYNYSILQ